MNKIQEELQSEKEECEIRAKLSGIANSFIYVHEQITYSKERIEFLLQCYEACGKLKPECLEYILNFKTPLSERENKKD